MLPALRASKEINADQVTEDHHGDRQCVEPPAGAGLDDR